MNITTVTGTSADFVLHSGAVSGAKPPVSVQRCVEEVKESLEEMWIPRIYRERVLSLRTRSHHLDVPPKANTVQVQHTFGTGPFV
jgi:hypothetical protein